MYCAARRHRLGLPRNLALLGTPLPPVTASARFTISTPNRLQGRRTQCLSFSPGNNLMHMVAFALTSTYLDIDSRSQSPPVSSNGLRALGALRSEHYDARIWQTAGLGCVR